VARVMRNDTALLLALREQVDALERRHDGLQGANVNTWWLLSNGILVFFMQCGFGMLEAGSVSARSTQNILLKNLMDTAISAIVWWSVGHGIAYEGTNPFIGVSSSAPTIFFSQKMMQEDADGWTTPGSESGYDWAFFFFQFTFAAAAATIVSGAVAERARLLAYLTYSTIITMLIFPVVVHWVWSKHGFLSVRSPDSVLGGSLDFAGSGVVHLTGGTAALCGAYIIGPRHGRFVAASDSVGGRRLCSRLGNSNPMPMPGHSTVLQALGTFILWMGWYGFNAGSTLRIDGSNISIAARIFSCTTLSASAGGITACLLERVRGVGRQWDVSTMCNGILSGLVAITAGCASVPPWSALVTGCLAGICYRVASHVMVEHLSVDDPLDAFAIHGVNGAWGVLASAIFSAEHYARQVTNDPGRSGGLLYGGGRLLGASVAQVVCTVVWSGALSTAMFASLRRLGVLRVPTTTGVDVRAAADDGGRDWDGAKLKAREPYVEATDPRVEPRSATAPIP